MKGKKGQRRGEPNPIAVVLLIIVLAYSYFENLPPEHCVENTQEIRNFLGIKGIEISSEETGQNKVCFRSKDEALIRDVINQSQSIHLKIELEKLRVKAEWWDTNGLFVIIAGLVCATAIVMFFIKSRQHQY